MAVDYAKVLKQDAPDAWTGEEAVCFLCGLARNEYLSIKDNAFNTGLGNVISGLAGAKISNSLSFQEQHPEQCARLVKVSDMKKTLESDTVVRVIPSYCDTKGTHYYRRKDVIHWAISKEYDIPAPLRAFVENDGPQTNSMGNEEKNEGRRNQQINFICEAAKKLGYVNLHEIPKGGKAAIRNECLKESLFTPSAFTHAWKEASKRGVISIQNKQKYFPPHT